MFPLIYSLIVSFQNHHDDRERHFVPRAPNYSRLFKDARLWEALVPHRTAITANRLAAGAVLGFLMAELFLDDAGAAVFVALLVLPTVSRRSSQERRGDLMFDVRFGPIGQILSSFAGEPVASCGRSTQLVYPAIIICEVWQWTPFMFLLLLAALSNVDHSQLEAAELDGAPYWRKLTDHRSAAITPVVAVAVLIRGLDLFRIFDIIWALTEAAPAQGPRRSRSTLTSRASTSSRRATRRPSPS